MDKVNTYTIIPTLIMMDSELSSTTKLLYGFLNSFASLYGHTNIDNGTLMTCLATSERTVQRGIVQLESTGYIKVVVNNGRRTITPLMTFKPPKKKKKVSPYESSNNINVEWEEL